MKKRWAIQTTPLTAALLCVSQVSVGCYSHMQGPVPAAPSLTAPRQARVSYYNDFRPVQLVHVQASGDATYGPLFTPAMQGAFLANGMEIHSLRDIEPAIASGSELSRCAEIVERAQTTRAILGTVAGVLVVGGATAFAVGAGQSSVPLMVGGGVGVGVGMIAFPLTFLLTGWEIQTRTNRGLTLYDPLLRQSLGLEPERVSEPRPQGPVSPCY